jgi:hypothetical protein
MDILCVWDREPRFLRHGVPQAPAAFHTITHPAQLMVPRDAAELTAFWRAHYGGEDWMFDISESWVSQQLSPPGTVILGVRDVEGLIGTVVGRPISATTVVGPRGHEQDAFVVEGLCIRRDYRGLHLAGWLLAWLDRVLNQHGPRLIVWSRETGAMDMSVTHVARHMYGFLRSADLGPAAAPITHVWPWSEFLDAWDASAPLWDRSFAIFPTSLRAGSPVPLNVWRNGNLVVAVSDTCRRTKGNGVEGERIWEVVWMGEIRPSGFLTPLTASMAAASVVKVMTTCEEILRQLQGPAILFLTDAPHQGGVHASWPLPWRVGTSGYHTTYLYNYMPPTFWNCTFMMPRVEI